MADGEDQTTDGCLIDRQNFALGRWPYGGEKTFSVCRVKPGAQKSFPSCLSPQPSVNASGLVSTPAPFCFNFALIDLLYLLTDRRYIGEVPHVASRLRYFGTWECRLTWWISKVGALCFPIRGALVL